MGKRNVSVLALAAIVFLGYGTFCWAAEKTSKPAGRMTNEVSYQEIWGDQQLIESTSFPTTMLLASEGDRGCCVWKTSKPSCVYTNRAFCERKAKQANVPFEFHKGTECKALPLCK